MDPGVVEPVAPEPEKIIPEIRMLCRPVVQKCDG